MITGISTASLYGRYDTEEAILRLGVSGVPVAELFLNCAYEYTPRFAGECARRAGDAGVSVRSIHAMTTQFEPQLFSPSPRQREDALETYQRVCALGGMLGASCYVFHGMFRLHERKRKEDNFDLLAQKTEPLLKIAAEHGMRLAWENVHYATYDRPGFASEMRKRLPEMRYTLDVKQAYFSGRGTEEYIADMGDKLINVHICGMRRDMGTCLPERGAIDFARLRRHLHKAGYGGAVMLEVYPGDYAREEELFDSWRAMSALFGENQLDG